MKTLGIETSCDETSVSIVGDGKKILSNIILSQTDLHKHFGGVVPEIACRKHAEVLDSLTRDSLKQAKISLKDIGLIAATSGPGLIGALLVGVSFAKSLSYRLGIPLIGVNHVEAHLYANSMEYNDIQLPCIGLAVSGGHTTLLEITGLGEYQMLGKTADDAAGEAFDKVAKLMGLGYPGGPIIDQLAKNGNPKTIKFPRAMTNQDNYDFSFSGLKTAVVYYVKGYGQYKKTKDNHPRASTEDIAASFQDALIEQLIGKTFKAAQDKKIKTILLGGGVSRNSRLRELFIEKAKTDGLKIYVPSPVMCTDNAAMVAGLGYARYKKYGASPADMEAYPKLPLMKMGSLK